MEAGLEPSCREVLEAVRYGKIQSATEAALSVLKAALRCVQRASSAGEARAVLRDFFSEALEARPANALLMNVIRGAILAVRDRLAEGDLEGVRDAFERYYRDTVRSIEEVNEAIARMAVNRIEDGDCVMTYSYSTIVLRALKLAKDEGREVEVYVPESRPGLEGLHTAKELGNYGIPVTLFVDSAIRYLMKEVDKVMIGAEAIAANGAVVSKVGTSLVALAASEARVNVFVLAPTMKFSPETIYGELVELLEKRPESLVSEDKLREVGLRLGEGFGVKVPMFDVTPPEYIDAIITEKGLIAPQAVTFMLREIYGWPFRFAPIRELLG
ncbi:MAG: initiation factor 2B [Thermoprotei archaeon]|nr:MAG: initiation factor 2B [Thermoprotei archaeon]